MWIGKNPVLGKRKGRWKENKTTKKLNPSHKGVLCRFCVYFLYPELFPWGNVFSKQTVFYQSYPEEYFWNRKS